MDRATQQLSEFVREKGISFLAISNSTGIPKGAVYGSLSGDRPLKANEFLAICEYIEVDPWRFSGNKD